MLSSDVAGVLQERLKEVVTAEEDGRVFNR